MATQAEIDAAISDALLSAVQNPLREESGTRVIQERSMDDLLKAAGALASDIASTQPHFGLRITQLVPPGCG